MTPAEIEAEAERIERLIAAVDRLTEACIGIIRGLEAVTAAVRQHGKASK
jgi:hypothetical protein